MTPCLSDPVTKPLTCVVESRGIAFLQRLNQDGLPPLFMSARLR